MFGTDSKVTAESAQKILRELVNPDSSSTSVIDAAHSAGVAGDLPLGLGVGSVEDATAKEGRSAFKVFLTNGQQFKVTVREIS